MRARPRAGGSGRTLVEAAPVLSDESLATAHCTCGRAVVLIKYPTLDHAHQNPSWVQNLMDFVAALRFSPRWDLPRRTSATTPSAASASSQASKLSSIFCKFGRRLGLRRTRRAR